MNALFIREIHSPSPGFGDCQWSLQPGGQQAPKGGDGAGRGGGELSPVGMASPR